MPIGTRRRFEVVRIPLDDLRAIKNSLGGTINDVVLTITASGLRALLLGRGESLPAQGLRAMVPMNVRMASEQLALGNKISSLFLDLPVAEPDGLERYFEIVARSHALKSEGAQAAGTIGVMEISGLAPPVVHSTIARALYATRLFNVTITNVPGPQQTLYAFGAPLREVRPLVPLAAEHAVGVAIVSYDGNAFFGVVADRDVVADLDVMLEAMRSSASELLAAAHPAKPDRAQAPKRRSSPTPAARGVGGTGCSGSARSTPPSSKSRTPSATCTSPRSRCSRAHRRRRRSCTRWCSPKLPLVPRYRQVVRFVPFSAGRPVWVDDPYFNLEYHLRRSALPTPGCEEQLP